MDLSQYPRITILELLIKTSPCPNTISGLGYPMACLKPNQFSHGCLKAYVFTIKF